MPKIKTKTKLSPTSLTWSLEMRKAARCAPFAATGGLWVRPTSYAPVVMAVPAPPRTLCSVSSSPPRKDWFDCLTLWPFSETFSWAPGISPKEPAVQFYPEEVREEKSNEKREKQEEREKETIRVCNICCRRKRMAGSQPFGSLGLRWCLLMMCLVSNPNKE